MTTSASAIVLWPTDFSQLIYDRHRGRLERRHAGPIQDKAPACAREQTKYHRMFGQDIVFENVERIIVQLEHAGIQREHVFRRGVLQQWKY